MQSWRLLQEPRNQYFLPQYVLDVEGFLGNGRTGRFGTCQGPFELQVDAEIPGDDGSTIKSIRQDG